MKPLPLHTIPADRMAAMSSRGARELRAERMLQVRSRWHDHEAGDARNSGCGGMAVIAVVVLGVISSFIISFW